MKTFMKFLQKKADVSGSTLEILQEVLSILRALYWNYNHAHWQAKGDDYYGNHLLFQRLYEAIPDEFDVLGEKLVAYFGEDAVDSAAISKKTQNWINKWNSEKDIVQRAINSEEDLQKVLQTVYTNLRESGDISLGLDDFLMATANSHETNLYLLQQIKRK